MSQKVHPAFHFIEKNRITIGLVLFAFAVVGGLILFIQTASENQPDKFSQLALTVQDEQAQISTRLTEIEKTLQETTDALNKIIEAEKTTKIKKITTTRIIHDSNPPESTSNPSDETKDKVNINSANLSQLESLPGIGPIFAQRIIDYRESNGNFTKIDEVKKVKGIGEKTFAKFRDKISI